MEGRAELITELREKFFKKLDDERPPDPSIFHPADINRIRNTDDWLRRFLEHNEFNIDDSLKMLWDSCSWRRKTGANDITEDNIRRDYLLDGSCFSYGKDKDGKKLFIIKSKLHVKGQKDFNELQRCIIYWFERLEREGKGNQISIFFDMADTGLSNIDMDFTKYLIGLFQYYYPNFLNYIIIFEMSWVLNATFKIIKSLLPDKAKPKIKMVTKLTIKDFVDPNNILRCWGGEDDYTFTFVPEAQSNSEGTINGKVDIKKVHFVEGSPLIEQPTIGFGDQMNKDHMLSIEPETITFNKEGNEIMGTITLKNITTDKSLSYKIKTTSPEKFKVRPSSGILTPSEQRTVTVILQSGYDVRGLFHNDRFLVMCLPLKDANTSSQELVTIWKSERPAEQHKLRCVDGASSGGGEIYKTHSILSSGTNNDSSMVILVSKVTNLEDHYRKMHGEITSLKYLFLYCSIVLTVLTAIAVNYVLNCHVNDM